MILTACIFSVVWLIVSYFRAQRALQWWYHRQSIQLRYQAEKIRDELLQESFTIRRNLELSLVDPVRNLEKLEQDSLLKIEQLHCSLEQLSDCLSPPYIEEDLSLAIQFMLERWRSHDSQLDLKVELPAGWRYESPESIRVILMTLDELLQVSLLPSTATSLYVNLKLQGDVGELIVQISYPDTATLSNYLKLKDLEYLNQTFRFLTSGACFCRKKNLQVIWIFRWRSLTSKL